MKRTALVTAGVLLFSGLVVQAGAGSAVSSSSQAVVKTAYNKEFGRKILVDGAGLTLYMFTTDLNG